MSQLYIPLKAPESVASVVSPPFKKLAMPIQNYIMDIIIVVLQMLTTIALRELQLMKQEYTDLS